MIVIVTRIVNDGSPPNFSNTFDTVVVASDLFLFIAGAILGILICTLYFPVLLKNVYILPPQYRENKLLNRVIVPNKGGGVEIYLNPRNFTQTVGMLITFVIWKFTPEAKRRPVDIHVDRKAFTIFYSIVALMVVIVLIALFLIFTVQH